ncbi:hypothetical protein N7G274_004120 [Stereocaulon virgatum]|uniref:MIT domain-containing protein n=1 Tax=Stereocaulon virgatum TaxID=373712 RepID=A0ABR4AC66_9LECA
MAPRPDTNQYILKEALHKANNAVFFDHRQYWAGAIRAYGESCSLLGQVMRTSLDEQDKMKVEAVRITYVRRIYELQDFVTPTMHRL